MGVITLPASVAQRDASPMRSTTALISLACFVAPLASQAPPSLLGTWADDYGSRHRVSDTLWQHDGVNRYHIVRWDSAGQFAIARNAADNAEQPNRYTRIDWMPLEMRPYIWAFCLTIWDAPTADSAARVTTARRDTPRTGCGGFPFTRLKPES